LVISNHSSFRVLFDKIAAVHFIWKIYLYFSTGNGRPREPALCQLYCWHTFVAYWGSADYADPAAPASAAASSSRARPPAVRLYDMKWDESGMKVSNRCSIIALVFLYPSCYRYPWRNCCFGRKCCVLKTWFCVDWQSVVMPVSVLWLQNFTLNLTTLFVLVVHVLRTAFGFIFLN